MRRGIGGGEGALLRIHSPATRLIYSGAAGLLSYMTETSEQASVHTEANVASLCY
jgi:hypothetical protein